MSDLKAQFEAAVQDVQTLARRPDDKTLLSLYAFYKQATQGDVTGARPTGMDLVGKAKYDAWAKLQGVAPAAAMQSYVDLVHRLQAA